MTALREHVEESTAMVDAGAPLAEGAHQCPVQSVPLQSSLSSTSITVSRILVKSGTLSGR